MSNDSTTPTPTPRSLTSVYRVVEVMAAHTDGWEEAAATAITDLAKTIPDLRIARVVDKDVVLLDDGTRAYRIRLAVSYRLDRRKVEVDGAVTVVRRCLVVANQTATTEELHRALEQRVAAGPVEFHVVAPLRLQRFTNAALLGDPVTGYASFEALSQAERDSVDLSNERLAAALERIRALGVGATGEVAAADPLAAVAAVLDRGSFDEIIVSTFPRSVSRWLGVDLPTRLARTTGLPVSHVEARA